MLLSWKVARTRCSLRSFHPGIPRLLKAVLHVHELHKSSGGSWCQPVLWVNNGRDFYHRGILKNVVCFRPLAIPCSLSGLDFVLLFFCFFFLMHLPFCKGWKTEVSCPQRKKYASQWPADQTVPSTCCAELHPQQCLCHVEIIAEKAASPTDALKIPLWCQGSRGESHSFLK